MIDCYDDRHQPLSSTIVINHHHQPSSSTINTNHFRQASSSTIIKNHTMTSRIIFHNVFKGCRIGSKVSLQCMFDRKHGDDVTLKSKIDSMEWNIFFDVMVICKNNTSRHSLATTRSLS